MIFGSLDSPDLQKSHQLMHPVWGQVFQWIKDNPDTASTGIHEIRGQAIYANVHGYETKPRDQCRYESHRRYVDFQFCLKGGEIIEWRSMAELKAVDVYNPEKDVIHYASPSLPASNLWLTQRHFAIFFPTDGHMPKMSDGRNSSVYKAVIKVEADLFN